MRIPPEIHLLILEYALCDQVIYGKRFFPIWPDFALVCRSWRARVHEVVFKKVALVRLQKDATGGLASEGGLAELCLSSALVSVWTPCAHNLGDCIRSLALYLVPPARLFVLLQQLPKLESLTLLNSLPHDWPVLEQELLTIPTNYTFPSVNGLYIFQASSKFKIDESLFIPRFVSRFPSVEYLTLEVPCAPQAPRSTWPPGPKNLIAFRSYGVREVVGSTALVSHYILSASPDTLRALKIWLLRPTEALEIARKHGDTLECLTLHPPPKWPRDRIIAWSDRIRQFTNLQHLSLSGLFGQRNDLMDMIPKKNLRHLEIALDNLKPIPGVLSAESIVNGLKECPLLERITINCARPILEIHAFASENQNVNLIHRPWDVLKHPSEPYPDYVVIGEFKYTSWEDVANPRGTSIPALTPQKSPCSSSQRWDHIIIRYV